MAEYIKREDLMERVGRWQLNTREAIAEMIMSVPSADGVKREMSFSQQIKNSNTDEWYTPAEAVELIVPYLHSNGYKKILCPFDKENSEFVRVLFENDFEVTFSHIETGTDFFDIENLEQYDAVVSNPPFSKRQKILERLFGCGVPFAMIMNFNGLFDSKPRWKMFKDNNFELLVPLGRIRFFNDNCNGKSPEFQSIYVCKGMSKKQIEFIDTTKDKEANE